MSYDYMSRNWLGKDYNGIQAIALSRMQWVEYINDGMVNPIIWAGAGKRKHGRGYEKGLRPNRVKRIREMQDKVLESAVIEASRMFHAATLPLVLNFEYHEPNAFMPELLGFADGDEYKINAFWTCHSKVGTFLVVKFAHAKRGKEYAAYFVRSMAHNTKTVFAIRTLPQFGSNRADAMARLCGQPWVINMGKTYSLYDMYTVAERDGLRTSVWFKFTDEDGIKNRVPKKNINQVFIDWNNTNVEWVWNKWGHDARWQPKPQHAKASFPDTIVPRGERNIHIVSDKLSSEQQNFMNLI